MTIGLSTFRTITSIDSISEKATSSVHYRERITAIALSVLLALASLLLSSIAAAAPTSALNIEDSYESNHTEKVSVSDSFGRDSPRSTVLGFISALGESNYARASRYINTSATNDPENLVREFKQALDAGGRFRPDLQISNAVEGDLSEELPPNKERVGNISIENKKIPLILERVVSKKGEQYWQFSNDTLSVIPALLEYTQPTLIERYTVAGLENKTLFNYQVVDLIAAIVLTVISFIMTYVLVWLGYHLIKAFYSRVRSNLLPLPSSVILPLSLVILALTLSEIMVYAGLSVALRELVNRFTEIVSWLALTWLLLQMVDVVFNRAITLSYKKNYIERVSIIGLMRKLFKVLLLILAVIFIFGNLGFDLTTGIAALGIGGLALALGAQKTIENLVGSVVVVADAPVSIGDYCKFENYEGTVIDIGIRSSRMRTLTRTVVTVPNGDFSSIPIENFTARDMFRFFHALYIKRNTNVNTINELIVSVNEFLNEHHLTNKEWNQVYIIELRQDCYVIQLQAYINAKKASEFYDKQNSLLIDVLNKVAEYNVEHALPTQQLILDQNKELSFENNSSSINSSNSGNSTVLSAKSEHKRGKREYLFTKLSNLKNKWL